MQEDIIINTDEGEIHVSNSNIGGIRNVVINRSASTKDQRQPLEQNELKKLLQALSVAIEKINEKLSEGERQRVARALQTLKDEAASEKPEQRWWSVSAEGLMKAAKNVGEMGKPILDIVTRIVAILSQKSS